MFSQQSIDNVNHKIPHHFEGFQLMTLNEFISHFSDDISEKYVKSPPHLPLSFLGKPYIEIICLVDMRKDIKNTMSKEMKSKLSKCGGAKRRKIKKNYCYSNIFNRIHGYVMLENMNGIGYIPQNKNVICFRLICSSYYSNMKGIGSYLMTSMTEICKINGYTDIILEVSNNIQILMEKNEKRKLKNDKVDKVDKVEDTDDTDDTEDENSEFNLRIIKEFNKKTLTLKDNARVSYVSDYYMCDIIFHYLQYNYDNNRDLCCQEQYYDDYDDYDDYDCYYNGYDGYDDSVNKSTTHIAQPVPIIKELGEKDYGGYWYQKGKRTCIGLMKFYEKFGFVEDPLVNTKWEAFTDIPIPSMILNLK